MTSKAPLSSRLGRELGWCAGSEANRGKNWDVETLSLKTADGRGAADGSVRQKFPWAKDDTCQFGVAKRELASLRGGISFDPRELAREGIWEFDYVWDESGEGG